jgi:hypothetical protein
MERIEIQLSKSKIFWGIGGSIVFVVLGICLTAFIADQQSRFNPLLIKGIGIASVLFFGVTGIYGFRKSFDRRIGLIIDENGITDNTGGISARFIQWNEIIGIRTEQIEATNLLLIDTTNPEKYLEEGNMFRIKIMKLNMRMYGTPLFLSSNTLQINFNELENILRTEFKKHQTS